MLDAGLIVSRCFHYAALLALFGGALFPLYALDKTHRGGERRWLAGAAALALAGGVGWFELTAASMAGDLGGAVDPQVLASVVQATEFGPLWLGRLALIALALAAVQVRAPRWMPPALAALALATLAATGHGREPDGWRGSVHAVADAVHLIAAGVWLGALWPLGAVLSSRAAADGVPVGDMLARFSGVASLAVAALLASGLVNSWYLVGAPGRLLATTYGQVLTAKIVLFVAMALLAATNRFWITPRLATGAGGEAWLGRLRRHVVAEQALGLLVIAVVSVLGTLEPAVST